MTWLIDARNRAGLLLGATLLAACSGTVSGGGDSGVVPDGATVRDQAPAQGDARADAPASDADGGQGDSAAADGNGPAADGAPPSPETCNGKDDDGNGQIDEGLANCGPCGRPYDTSVPAPYPIGATWMYKRGIPCEWQDELERFHRMGGHSVWQFGPSLEVRSEAQIKAHAELSSCSEGGVHCVDRAKADLSAAGATVANWLVYDFNEHYSDKLLRCPALDRKLVVGGRTFYRVVLPHTAGGSPCSVSGRSVDVLLSWYKPGAYAPGEESNLVMARVADALGMQLWLGMPAPRSKPGQPWAVDSALLPAWQEWSYRVLSDYQHRFGAHASFAGVYQAFEQMMTSSSSSALLGVYSTAAKLVHSRMPGKRLAVSPYWDVNRTQGDVSVASTKEGFKRIARQGVDIIAPQDGRGTGKAALFWPHQLGETINSVDPVLGSFLNVNGGATFGAQFNGSTMQLYSAVQQARDELAAQEGIQTELWANIEAFEGLTSAPCSSGSLNRTDKQRLDWALTFAGAFPRRIVSFMWDAYYTCTPPGHAKPLYQEIVADHARPIVAGAFFWDVGGTQGLVLRGFNLARPGTSFKLTWWDNSWTIHGDTIAPTSSTAGWGASHDRSPLLDEVWLPFDRTSLAPGFVVHISATGPGGTSHHSYSLGY